MKGKKKVYFKVISTKFGHHGVFYHLGLNIDPNPRPLDEINSCQRGAIYFCDEKELIYFSEYGDSIAWLTAESKIKKDEAGDKYKAHKINIIKILPFKKAIPLLKKISILDYKGFGIDVTAEKIIAAKNISLEEKLDYLEEGEEDFNGTVLLILKNKTNKKFIKLVKDREYNWTNKEISLFIDEGLYELITDDILMDLAVNGRYELIQELINSNPKKFIKGLCELI